MGTVHVNERVQKHHNTQRKSGLRLTKILIPDTRQLNFAKECRRQFRLAAKINQSLIDIDGWTE
ncbi:antitoxin MazE-like protein [Bartonella sp. B23]